MSKTSTASETKSTQIPPLKSHAVSALSVISGSQIAQQNAPKGPASSSREVQTVPSRLESHLELVGYDAICAMLAVDGKSPCRRTVMRHLRRHRDIVTPVKVGAHVGYPVEQILKWINRLKGKSSRSEMFI